MKIHEGRLDASGMKFVIVASRFNELIVDRLIQGAESTLLRLGAKPTDISLVRVPGAFEIAGTVSRLLASKRFDAAICLGAVIRGETPHFDHVAGQSASAIARLAERSDVPVIYGVLTTDTVEQAMDRAGIKAGNKGAEAASAAVEMARLYESLRKEHEA